MNILRIKEIMEAQKISGSKLSEMVGVSSVSISKIVTGNSFPKPDLLVKIANALNTDLPDLFISLKSTSDPIYIKKKGEFQYIGELRRQ